MTIFIKEWPDRTASLMTSAGQYLFHFRSVDNAITACRDWYGISKDKIISTATGQRPATEHHT